MASYEKAIKAIKAMIETGTSLKEAIREAAAEFGQYEAELWGEFE